MSSLMLPRHIGEARQQQKAMERLRAAPAVNVVPDDAAVGEFFESEKQRIRDEIGPVLGHVRLFLNAVLVAVYKRPEKMPGT